MLEEGVELEYFAAAWIAKPAHRPQKTEAVFAHHLDQVQEAFPFGPGFGSTSKSFVSMFPA